MSSPASNIRSSSLALAVFLAFISFNLVIASAAHRNDADRAISRRDEGDPMLAFDHADDSPAGLRLTACVDFDRVAIQPERLRSLEINPVLGEVRRAFDWIEFEGHRLNSGEIG